MRISLGQDTPTLAWSPLRPRNWLSVVCPVIPEESTRPWDPGNVNALWLLDTELEGSEADPGGGICLLWTYSEQELRFP